VGNEIFIYFNIGETQIVGRIPSFVNVQTGKSLNIAFNNDKLHFFDAETELSIS